MVTTGRSAFRAPCRRTTDRSLSPFARAVRTKSWPSTSSRLDRVIRAMIASGIVPSAMAGRIRWRKASTQAPHWPVMRALIV